jgi:translation elongation factor EF-4
MDYLSAEPGGDPLHPAAREIIFDFFDQLKSRTRATPHWTTSRPASRSQPGEGRHLLQGEPVDAFSQIVHATRRASMA